MSVEELVVLLGRGHDRSSHLRMEPRPIEGDQRMKSDGP